jgi:hypothetical protein
MSNSNPFVVVKEMFGRVQREVSFLSRSLRYKLYHQEPSVDYSKTNYHLARAIFYASIVSHDSEEYGKEFLLGSSFGKPIINTSAAFAFSRTPEIFVTPRDLLSLPTSDAEEDASESDLQYNKDLLDAWLLKYSSELFKTARNTLRDGDQYIKINSDLTPTIIPPEQVTVIDDPLTGEILGYDVQTFIQTENESDGLIETIEYMEEYRKTSPYYILKTRDDQTDEYEELERDGGESNENQEGSPIERALPIVGFHNESDARERYGSSEFQNLYYLFANYHAVLAEAIKGNMYDTAPATYFKGIENWDAWIKSNGVYNEATSQYELKWEKDKVFVGGDGFSIERVQGGEGAEKAKTILELLFKLIVQASETPEFVFGTAVKSSKASVSEQSPVAVVKAKRKQREFAKFYEQLFKTILEVAETGGWAKVNTKVDISIKFPEIMDDDLTINLDIVKFLSEQGLITDRVKMIMLSMNEKIDDLDEEIEEARRENDVKMMESIKNLPYTPVSPQANQVPEEEIT